MARPPSTHVALLRGINVGGKNRIAMKDLVRLFEAAGARAVRTYVQSGNVVFAAAQATQVGAAVERAIAEELGLAVPIVLRSGSEIARVARENPFLAQGAPEDTLHVAFLAGAPRDPGALDPDRSPGDAFVVQGREVYLHLPNGVGRTKLSNAWLDAKLATTSTMRNWRTVMALVELAAS